MDFRLFTIFIDLTGLYGFEIMDIETRENDRALLSFSYNAILKRIWIDLLFFNFRIYLK